MKMPTIVGIFIFISRGNFMLSWVENERSFITLDSGLIYGYKAQKNIISLRPEPLQQPTASCHLLIAKGFGGPTGLVACAYLNDHVWIVTRIMPNVSAIAATWIHLSHYTRSRTILHNTSSVATSGLFWESPTSFQLANPVGYLSMSSSIGQFAMYFLLSLSKTGNELQFFIPI